MNDENTLKEIKQLQKRRICCNCLRHIPLFAVLRDKYDERKEKLINTILDDIAAESGLLKKYEKIDINSLSATGNKVWMLWYTGLDDAPDLVKKCVSIAKELDDADVTFIDKNNLEEFFTFESNIRNLFEQRKISIQTFSDIVRLQLMSRHGGFWIDATVFVTHKDFITKYKDLPYFSVKHKSNNLLLKEKWNEYFTLGRWSTYCSGSGKGNPIFSFIYDMYIEYFKKKDSSFDYFQTDYIWLYAYEHFSWAKELIDHIEPVVECSYFIHRRLLKKYNQNDWNHTISHNEIQKLGWRAVKPEKLKKKQHAKYETYYRHFLSYENKT